MPRKPEFLPIQRIQTRLQDGLHARLTLLCSPPGYGKTSALRQILSAQGRRSVWITLSEEDNSLPGLTHHMETQLSLAGWEPSMSSHPTARLLWLMTQYQAFLNEDVHLVLDDYQLIQSKTIHEAIFQLVSKASERIHIFISTQTQPPFPVSRIRLQGELVELFTDQLNLTRDEIDALILFKTGHKMEEKQLDRVWQCTQGWPAMICLLANTLNTTHQLDVVLRTFNGAFAPIYSFIEDEIFTTLPATKKDFLLATSILDQITPEIALSVLNRPDTAQTLGSLVRNQLLVPVPNGYRYHPILADYLRLKLREKKPGKITELHHRAAEWYEKNGRLQEALEHRLMAGDCEQAANLINQIGWNVLNDGAYQTVLDWCDRLEAMAETPYQEIAELKGFALIQAGSLDQARNLLANLPSARAMLGTARIALYTGQYHAVEKVYQDALNQLEDSDQVLRCQIEYQSGMAKLFVRDLPGAEKIFNQALARAEKIADLVLIQMSTIALSLVYHNRGNLHRSIAMLERVIELENGQPSERTVMILARLAQMHLELGHFEQSTNYIEICLNQGERHAFPEILAYAYLTAARIARIRGDYNQAVSFHQSAARLASKGGFFEKANLAERMLLYTVMDELGVVESWAAENGLSIELAEFTGDESYLVLSRWFLQQGKFDDAVVVLEKMLSQARQNDWRMAIQQVEPWLAVAHQLAGQPDKALHHLRQALSNAMQQGFCLAYLEIQQQFPAILRPMLESTRQYQPEGKQANKLLDFITRNSSTAAQTLNLDLVQTGVSSGMIEVRVFGGLRIFREGLELAKKGWRTERARDLMAYFAVHYNQPVPTEILIETFWPGRSPNETRRLLHTNLYYLRRTLLREDEDRELFIHRSGTYMLNLEYFWIDIKKFDELILTRSDRQALNRARNLATGPCLLGLYDGWALEVQRQYEEKFTDVYIRLADLHAQAGNLAEACAFAQKALDLDPLHETTVRQMMQWYRSIGEQASAIQCYETFKHLLAEELGSTPGPETLALARLLGKE